MMMEATRAEQSRPSVHAASKSDAVDHQPLAQLAKVVLLQAGNQLGLSHQQHLQELGLRRFEVGEQSNLFQNLWGLKVSSITSRFGLGESMAE